MAVTPKTWCAFRIRKNASGFQRRIHKTIDSKSTRSKWIIVCIIIGIMLLHLKALGGRRVVKEHTKKVPVCLLHLKDFGCAVELSKMDPRTTLLKRADSFEDGLNCGRIRFEKELNRIYFTAQHIWCFTALINEVNYSTFYSLWMNFYTNIIFLGYLELFDSFRGGPIRWHLDQARSEQTGILMLSSQIHNDSLCPITGWPGVRVLFEGDAMKHSCQIRHLAGPCVPLRSSSVFLKTFVA